MESYIVTHYPYHLCTCNGKDDLYISCIHFALHFKIINNDTLFKQLFITVFISMEKIICFSDILLIKLGKLQINC